MPLDVAKFNSAFSGARYRVRKEEGDVGEEQVRLRELIPDDVSDVDREWAVGLIESLAEPVPPPRQWSDLYHEAGQVHAAAYRADGTVEERIAALEDARRKIWAIADRASVDEEADIRAMTRALEHLENALRDPTWPLEDPPGQTD
jgi:hypothetical protein